MKKIALDYYDKEILLRAGQDIYMRQTGIAECDRSSIVVYPHTDEETAADDYVSGQYGRRWRSEEGNIREEAWEVYHYALEHCYDLDGIFTVLDMR